MVSMSDQMFKAGEEEEELTVLLTWIKLHTLMGGYLDRSEISFLFEQQERNESQSNGSERQRVHVVVFFLFVQNERLHKWSLVQSHQVFAHNGQTDGLFGKGGGGAPCPAPSKNFLRRLSAP